MSIIQNMFSFGISSVFFYRMFVENSFEKGQLGGTSYIGAAPSKPNGDYFPFSTLISYRFYVLFLFKKLFLKRQKY